MSAGLDGIEGTPFRERKTWIYLQCMHDIMGMFSLNRDVSDVTIFDNMYLLINKNYVNKKNIVD